MFRFLAALVGPGGRGINSGRRESWPGCAWCHRDPGPQVEVLASVRDRLAPGRSRDEFIEEHINDPAVRRARSEALRENARPLAFPREVITVL